MEEETKKQNKALESKKEKIKEWLRNPYNLAFLGILAFLIALRFYYFFLTKNQPLWWDESDYMSAAKSYAGIVNYTLPAIRLPGFSMLMSLFFIFNITSEPLMRFIALFIPSIIVLVFGYFMIKSMYPDKKIALISLLIFGVLWEHLFYSNRFHTENFSLIFEFLAIFILFKCFVKKEDAWIVKPKYSLIWIALFSIISVLFRPGNVIFIPAIVLFIVILKLPWMLENKQRKNISLGVIAAAIIVGIIIMFNYTKIPVVSSIISYYYHPGDPFAWNVLGVFYGFYESVVNNVPPVFFYAFIFGILLLAWDLFVNFNKLSKLKDNGEDIELKSDVFNILIILAVLFSFIFLLRTYSGYEFRWFFPLLPGMLAFTSKGIINFSRYVGIIVKSKKLVYLLIVIILFLGTYNQMVHADSIIKNKIDSYQQVKDAGIWLKENSDKNDLIITASHPQTVYYSERNVTYYDQNETSFDAFVNEAKPKYVIISAFEAGFTPKWLYDWPARHNSTAFPVKAYFADKENTQPILIIYELKY